MSTMKRFVLLFILTVLGLTAHAADDILTSELKRKMYYDVLTLLDKYESSLSMLEPENDAELFKSLFVSDESPVYNDLLSITSGKILTAAEYSNALLSEVTPGARVWLKDINHGEPIADGDSVWMVRVTFKKEYLYYDECAIKFSSSEFYLTDYQLAMDIVWDASNRDCHIRRVDGIIDSDYEPLPDGFVVLKISENTDNFDLLYYGDKLNYNIDSIVFLGSESLTDDNAFYYPLDDDIRLSVDRDFDCSRMIHVQYKPKRMRLRFHWETAVNIEKSGIDKGGFYSITGVDYSHTNNRPNGTVEFKSEGQEFGIDLGFVPISGRFAKIGLMTGIGLSSSTISTDIKNLYYGYNTLRNADIDGDKYSRFYDIKDMKYKLSIKDMVVPLYLDWEFFPFSGFSIYADAGAKMYLNLDRNVSDFSATYSTYGIYGSEYQFLVLGYDAPSEISEYNNFVKDGSLNIDNLSSRQANIPTLWYDAYGEVGFRIRFSDSKKFFRDLFLDAGVTYQYTLTPFNNNSWLVLYSDNHQYNNHDKNNYEYNYPKIVSGWKPVSFTTQDGEKARNIADYISEMSRTGSIRAKVSITYRF